MNPPLGVHWGKLIWTPRQSTLTQTQLADQPVGDGRRVADPPSPFMLPPSIQVQSDTALTQHTPHSPTHTQQTCSHNSGKRWQPNERCFSSNNVCKDNIRNGCRFLNCVQEGKRIWRWELKKNMFPERNNSTHVVKWKCNKIAPIKIVPCGPSHHC